MLATAKRGDLVQSAMGVARIVVGNGGAPLTAGNYGFTTVEQLSTGWQIKNYDYSTVLPTTTFTVP